MDHLCFTEGANHFLCHSGTEHLCLNLWLFVIHDLFISFASL